MPTSHSTHLIAALLATVLVNPALGQSNNNPHNPETKKKISVPRLTAAKKAALPVVLPGTMIFQTDSISGFYYYTGKAWLNLSKYQLSSSEMAITTSTRIPLPGASSVPNRVTTLAGQLNPGYLNGAKAWFHYPQGIAVGANGLVYVADTYNHCVRIIGLDGEVSLLAGSTKGYADGTGTTAFFHSPTGVAVDLEGTVYVADAGNSRIRKISPWGEVTTLAGKDQGFKDGVGEDAAFRTPCAIAVGSKGTLYVADAGNNRICRIAPDGTVVTLAGTLSGLAYPTGIAVDKSDNVYVADTNNHRIQVISPDGTMSTLVGSTSGYVDGARSTALFCRPSSLAVNDAGTVFVSELGNNRVRVISPTGEVSTVAGNGSASFADGMGPTASFTLPAGIALDATGTVYIADTGNNSIRKIVTP